MHPAVSLGPRDGWAISRLISAVCDPAVKNLNGIECVKDSCGVRATTGVVVLKGL